MIWNHSKKVVAIYNYDTFQGVWNFKIFTIQSLFSCCSNDSFEFELHSTNFDEGWIRLQYMFLDQLYQEHNKSYKIQWDTNPYNIPSFERRMTGTLKEVKLTEIII